MSTYEKIAAVLIATIAVAGIVFSYHEVTEPRGPGGSDFDESIGQNFRIGQFVTLVSQHSSGGAEDACTRLQPVIVAVLHDITQQLEELTVIRKPNDTFQINQDALSLFCNKEADATLSDARGNHLVLQKPPFVPGIPAGPDGKETGTDVKINATLIPAGSTTPLQWVATGEELLPDAYLK